MRRPYYGFILFLVIFNLASLILFSCSKNGTESNDNTITVSGKVTLEGQSDHSGVTVRLYKPVTLDTALVRINRQYPNIGVQISQETEFDHREQTASYSTTTNASGDWRIEKVEKGSYNVVAEKNGFGWGYVLDLPAGNASTMQLNSEKPYSGTYNSQNLVFENDFIRINGNTLFDQNSQITFRGNNYIVFNSNQLNLIFQGGVNFQNSLALFLLTANDNVNCRFIIENNNNLQIKNITVQDGLEVIIRNSKVDLRNSIFYNPEDIALRVSIGSGNISNCLMRNSKAGLNLDQIVYIANEKNIYFQNQGDVYTDFIDSSLFKNNMFYDSDLNLDLVSTNSNIQNNEFYKSEQNISIADVSDISVDNNHFKGNTNNIRLNSVSHQFFVVDFLAKQNNFIETNNYIIFVAAAAPRLDTLYAINNYWGTPNESTIQEKIYDGHDISSDKYVIYSPFLLTEVASAGIKP